MTFLYFSHMTEYRDVRFALPPCLQSLNRSSMHMSRRNKNGVMPLGIHSSKIFLEVLRLYMKRTEEFWDSGIYSRIAGMLRAKNLGAILRLSDSLDTEFSSVERYYVKSQFLALLKKYPFTRDEARGYSPRAEAEKKFLASEHRCKRVNQRFYALSGRFDRYAQHLTVMRNFIERVLGDEPGTRWMELCDFGPGASVGTTGNLTSFGRKLLNNWTCCPTTTPYALASLYKNFHILRFSSEGWENLPYTVWKECVRGRLELVSHNKLSFVAKSFKTDRSIAIEPSLNTFVQKGVDVHMRALLRERAGIDLTDQGVNQRLARLGSLGGEDPLVTIDLSSASDSLAIQTVKRLLPWKWFELLDVLRSPSYKFRGKVHTYHKFVSMGNGFCFPLQTLIFASICVAGNAFSGAPMHRFSVYGDDIIVPQSSALVVIELLKEFGFRVNAEKTYIVGPFRESCGKDWLGGLDVRPVYLDFRFNTNVDLYKFHNSTLRCPFPSLFTEVREYLRACCPSEVRFMRPYEGNTDSAFEVSKDLFMSSKFARWKRNTWSWSWKEVLSTSLRDRFWGYDPTICNELEYIGVIRGSTASCPYAIRRKVRTSVRTQSYWGREVM